MPQQQKNVIPPTAHLSLQQNVPLADKNWFGTGGPAQWFCQPETSEEFAQAVSWAHAHNTPIFMLGQGANILIHDEGFMGLVIRPKLTWMKRTPHCQTYDLLTCGAGINLQECINYCLDQQLGGLEEFSGIPGTIGASVYINLHYYDFLLEHFLHSAEVIEKKTGRCFAVDPAWFEFGYNQSKLLKKEHFLVSATFKLKKLSALETMYAKGRHVEIIRHRTKRYPHRNTCGSFFRNFTHEEVAQEKTGKKLIYVAYYLEKLGVKGELSIGGARVSHQHANMIVTNEQATSHDIIELAGIMQRSVYEEFGIIPQPECQLVGFTNYPFL